MNDVPSDLPRSWSGKYEPTVGSWRHPAPPQDLPPLRLTRRGRAAVRITVLVLLILAAAIGFLLRTPTDRALERCDASQPCSVNDRSERT